MGESTRIHKKHGAVPVLLALLLAGLSGCGSVGPATIVAGPAAIILGWTPGFTRGVPLTAPLTVYFSRAVDRASLQRSWRLTPAAPGSFYWGDRSVAFTPERPLRPGTYYHFSAGRSARDDQGKTLANRLDVFFATGDPLRATSTTPATGTTAVPLNSVLAVSFNHPMVALAGLGANASDPSGWRVRIWPATAGQGHWLGTSTWIFRPDGELRGSSHYSISISGATRDADGDALSGGLSWSFGTVGPRVVDLLPRAGERFANPAGPVRITFNQPMDRTVTARAFSLEAGARVPGTITWHGNALLFTPNGALDPARRYTATLAPLARAAGGVILGRALHWRFQVVGPPRVVSSKPAERSVWPQSFVELHFSAPMDLKSVQQHLSVSPSIANLGTSYYPFDNHHVDRADSIVGSFQPSTDYAVTISAGALDAFGRALPAPFTLHFRTSPLPASVVLFGPPGVYGGISFTAGQMMNAPVQTVNLARVRYTLLRTDAAGALKATAQGSNSGPVPGQVIRSWIDRPPHTLDRTNNLKVRLTAAAGSPLPPGIYLLVAQGLDIPSDRQAAGFGSATELVAATNTSLTLKAGLHRTMVWANSVHTGRPVAGISVRIIDANGKTVDRGRTDGRGVVFFQRNANGLWAAMVDDGRHFGLSVQGWSAQSPANLLFPAGEYTAPPNGAYAYTDRPIYRPGQRVFFRAVLWRDLDGQYSLLGRRSAAVAALDMQGRPLFSAHLMLDRFGSINGSFVLPRNASTGPDSISFSIPRAGSNDFYAYAPFTVAEYRKPEFITSLTVDRPTYTDGEVIDATVAVNYVFGAPVTGQTVSWTASTMSNPTPPPGLEGYAFGDQDAQQAEAERNSQPGSMPHGVYGAQVALGTGRTDAYGRLHIRVPVNLVRGATDQTITIEATTTDINHQSITGHIQVMAHKATFGIGLLAGQQIAQAGRVVTIDAAAVRDNGLPQANQTLTVHVARRTYTSRLASTQAEQSYWQQVPHDVAVSATNLATNRWGRATFTFTPHDAGTYYIAVEGTDSAGRRTLSSLTIYAGGTGFTSFGQSSNTTIQLRPDRTSYQVGETAHILVAAPFDRATALVSVERADVRRVRVVYLTSNASTVDVKIHPADLPNVYVSITIYRGWRQGSPPDWRSGTTNLPVRVTSKTLSIRLRSIRKRYHPGDTVIYRVTTLDSQRRPTPAELSLALVDTAVLALQGDPNPNIVKALYGERYLAVTTQSEGAASIDHLAQRPGFRLRPGGGYGGGGGGGGPALSMAGAVHDTHAGRLRRHFEDTAYWAATVRTGANGQATVSVTLPDNVTTWRLDARAVTLDQRVGQATLLTVSSQDILLRPDIPRFFLQGDSLQIGTVVNSNLDWAETIDVNLRAVGLKLSAAGGRRVQVPAHGERLVLWPASVTGSGPAQLTFRAVPVNRGVQGDAVQNTVPIHLPLTDETVATAGQIFGSIKQLVVVPAGARVRPGALTVRISSALTAGIGSAYAVFRPNQFDSNDDLANRILAAGALRSLPASLSGLSRDTFSRLPSDINTAIAKLQLNQLPDGGWPWFNGPGVRSDPRITTDIVEALSDASGSGRRVTGTLARAVQYLRGHLATSGDPLPVQAVLGQIGQMDRQSLSAIAADSVRRFRLNSAQLARLIDWAQSAGAGRLTATLVGELDAAALVSATGAHWETAGGGLSAVGATAAALVALLWAAPRDPLIPAGVRWLALARQGSAWDCPANSAHALQALAAYARSAHEGRADFRYQLLVNGISRLSGGYTPANQMQSRPVRVAIEGLRRGADNSFRISRVTVNGTMGRGPLYYLAQLRYFLPAGSIAARNQGIVVIRHYLDLAGKPLASIAAGSVVRVELTIDSAQTLEYLQVDDPLPAGFEPIDQTLQTSRQAMAPATATGHDIAPYLTHTDRRDDRVSLYAQTLPPGRYTYSYLAQATVSGSYGVAPVHAVEAFFPEVFGRSKGQEVRIR